MLYVRTLPVLHLVGTLWEYPPPALPSLCHFFLAPSLFPCFHFPSLPFPAHNSAPSRLADFDLLPSDLAVVASFSLLPIAFSQLSCCLLLS